MSLDAKTFTLTRAVNGALRTRMPNGGILGALAAADAAVDSAAFSGPGAAAGGGGWTTIFTDDFASGDLSKTQNGFAWTSGTNNTVIANRLRLRYQTTPTGQRNFAEQKFTLGNATAYTKLRMQYDLTIPANYNHVSGNNKSIAMFWRNNNPGTYDFDDGYQDPNTLGASIEMSRNPPGYGSVGGSYLCVRNWGSGYDYNMQGMGQTTFDLIEATGVEHTNNYIIELELGSFAPADFAWGTAGDAVLRVYKNGALFYEKTDMNLFKAGFPGWNRGYLLGWANGAYAVDTEFFIDNFSIAYR